MYRNRIVVIQIKVDDSQYDGPRFGDGITWLRYGYILRIKPRVYEGTWEKKYSYSLLYAFVLSNWKNRVAIF